jgi:hypothetical protein
MGPPDLMALLVLSHKPIVSLPKNFGHGTCFLHKQQGAAVHDELVGYTVMHNFHMRWLIFAKNSQKITILPTDNIRRGA